MFSPRPAGNPPKHVLSTEDKQKRPGLLRQVPGDAAAFFFFFFCKVKLTHALVASRMDSLALPTAVQAANKSRHASR